MKDFLIDTNRPQKHLNIYNNHMTAAELLCKCDTVTYTINRKILLIAFNVLFIYISTITTDLEWKCNIFFFLSVFLSHPPLFIFFFLCKSRLIEVKLMISPKAKVIHIQQSIDQRLNTFAFRSCACHKGLIHIISALSFHRCCCCCCFRCSLWVTEESNNARHCAEIMT